ncbi:ribosome biogenesis protein SLX9 homolog isoform X2 [Haemorhous mexicanus]|uniref:ribosome biogenesis protein SLX9 homolog isoform X2 n=1 Tax=Haemorhous mexicanus TaxID=30427 RepID=UPI0028BD8CB6|nr:ribosome biogenesis protein SLX9 homolog isoform X2 [Haemorhous mexicanus]
MVGKAKRPRLHRAAPRPARDPPPLPGPGLGPAAGGWSAAAGKDWDFSSSGVFSGLKIDPDTLVKKLDLDSRSIISSRTGLEEKPVLSKKEKMKLRKERWLQKIESVKMAKQKQKAEAKRKATPVVGDMQPLMEALPELSYLTTGGRGRKPLKREEEVARFQEVISDPQYRANPLLAISKHLSERLRQGGAGELL